MLLEVFSKLNNSVIHCDSVTLVHSSILTFILICASRLQNIFVRGPGISLAGVIDKDILVPVFSSCFAASDIFIFLLFCRTTAAPQSFVALSSKFRLVSAWRPASIQVRGRLKPLIPLLVPDMHYQSVSEYVIGEPCGSDTFS